MRDATPEEVSAIIAGLTRAQREIMTRPNGRYQDDAADVIALMNLELIGTCNLPLGDLVRAALQKENDGE